MYCTPLSKDSSEGRIATCCQRSTTRDNNEMLLSPNHMQEMHICILFKFRWAGEWLRLKAPAILADNLGSVPSTHLRKLESTGDSSSRRNALWPLLSASV